MGWMPFTLRIVPESRAQRLRLSRLADVVLFENGLKASNSTGEANPICAARIDGLDEVGPFELEREPSILILVVTSGIDPWATTVDVDHLPARQLQRFDHNAPSSLQEALSVAPD
ncbi:hypothetical protein XH87_10915 [Bradyrhizobium sp. CCBAU 53415]|nr:hypothetical protein [Bradyrhizobium sp. CCBAU 53415]